MSEKPVIRMRSALRRGAVFLGVGIVAASVMLVSAAPASGAPAQELISPTVFVSVSQEHPPNLIVFGEGCVDADGHSGTVSIAYTTPGQGTRTFVVPQLGLYPDGSWAADITLDSLEPGKITVAAMCDLYNSQSAYPLASTNFAMASASPSTVYPGQKFTITVSGFPANTAISALWEGYRVLGFGFFAEIVSGVTDANGDATLAATDPGLPPGRPASQYLDKTWGIFIMTPNKTTTAFTTVTLVAAPTPGTTPSAQSFPDTTLSAGPETGAKLADTGVDAAALGVVAAGLLLTGGLSLAAGRRRS